VLPETVHTLELRLEKVTARPDEAVALTVYEPPITALVGAVDVNVIVCGALSITSVPVASGAS
jgi:hypothetical protein